MYYGRRFPIIPVIFFLEMYKAKVIDILRLRDLKLKLAEMQEFWDCLGPLFTIDSSS